MIAAASGVVNSVEFFAAVIFVPLLIIPIAALVFGGPALVAIVGGLRGRPGNILGPILLFALGPLVAFLDISINAAIARNQDFMSVATPVDPEATLVLEIDERSCREDCLAVIAQRNGQVTNAWGETRRLTEGKYREIKTYVKSTGQDCVLVADKINQATYESVAHFLSLGIADTCWKVRVDEKLPDGFAIRVSDLRDNGGIALGTFRGEVFELIERRNGVENIVGRRLAGRVSTHVPNVLLVPAALLGLKLDIPRLGSVNTKIDFYREVLNVNLSEPVVEGDQLVAALSGLLELMEKSQEYRFDSKAVKAFTELVRKSDCQNLKAIVPQIRRLLLTPNYEAYFSASNMFGLCYRGDLTRLTAESEAFLVSEDPEDVALGLLLLKGSVQASQALKDHRQLILRALEGDDPESTTTAIIALSRTKAAFAQSSLHSLAFGPFLRREGAPVLYPLLDAIDTPLDEATTARAHTVFMDSNSFTIEQRLVAFAMIARAKGQVAAFELLTRLKGRAFAETVVAIDRLGWRSILNQVGVRWQKNQREILASRKGEVSEEYMGAFSKIAK
ncbi:hypothetical protein [Dongia sp.]|uniref:hypothetical protein n=1 Tax=Dongia sp. TaxID=1977262 RepID=UPI0035B44C79